MGQRTNDAGVGADPTSVALLPASATSSTAKQSNENSASCPLLASFLTVLPVEVNHRKKPKLREKGVEATDISDPFAWDQTRNSGVIPELSPDPSALIMAAAIMAAAETNVCRTTDRSRDRSRCDETTKKVLNIRVGTSPLGRVPRSLDIMLSCFMHTCPFAST